MRKVRWLVILAAAASVLAAAACGGGTTSKDKTATAAAGGSAQNGATKASGQGDATKAPASTPEATKSSNGSSGGGGSSDWDGMKEKFLQSTFHASYKVSGSGADQFADGKMEMFKDGDKRFRFDITAIQDGQQIAIIFIENDTASAFCLKDAGELGTLLGIEPGKGVCFKSDPNDANNPVGSLSSLFEDLETMDVTVLEKSSRKVVGKDTTCYKTRDNKTNEVSTACFTKDGVLMYSQSEGTSAFEMEATDVSGSVSGGDFDLPYEVRDLPGFGG
jgi:hypothetical protein